MAAYVFFLLIRRSRRKNLFPSSIYVVRTRRESLEMRVDADMCFIIVLMNRWIMQLALNEMKMNSRDGRFVGASRLARYNELDRGRLAKRAGIMRTNISFLLAYKKVVFLEKILPPRPSGQHSCSRREGWETDHITRIKWKLNRGNGG